MTWLQADQIGNNNNREILQLDKQVVTSYNVQEET